MSTGMSPRRLHALGLTLWITAASLGLSNAAVAHPSGNYYNFFWASGSRTVPWRFTAGVTGSNMRDRAKDGAQKWNQENQPVSFDFENGQSDYSTFDGFSCPGNRPFQKDAVHWQSFSSGGRPNGLMEVDKCISGNGDIHDFQLIVNSDQDGNFYNGTGTPGNNDYDSWSFFSEEFGHATGWANHFGVASHVRWQSWCQDDYVRLLWIQRRTRHDLAAHLGTP